MIFYGNAMPTSVRGVELMGPGLRGLGETGWIRQAQPRSNVECRDNAAGKLECRPYGATGVKALQTSLKALADTTGQAKYDPRGIDGAMGFNTRMALGYAINDVGATFSSWLRLLTVPLAVRLTMGYKDLDDIVIQNADALAAAISLAAVRLAPGGGAMLPSSGQPMPAPVVAPAWYTTTNGKIGLGLGAVVLLLLVLRK